jgi:hypothetical protein
MIKKTCSTLKMGLWNVGDLISKQFNKTTDPEFLRKNYNFDLLFLVETINKSVLNPKKSFSNFTHW